MSSLLDVQRLAIPLLNCRKFAACFYMIIRFFFFFTYKSKLLYISAITLGQF